MGITPLWMFFIGTIVWVVVAIEIGFRLGHVAHRRSEDEKESPVSAIAGSILGLLAFILAFTFSIASNRFDTRKELVREDANAIRTAFARADFLPAADRAQAQDLLRQYVDLRLKTVGLLGGNEKQNLPAQIEETAQIQQRLWDMAVANARLDMNSDVAALYIESLNEMASFSALRIAVGLQARIPDGIWYALYILIFLGMLAVGYQTGIAGSKRTWSVPILAFSFSLVIALIAAIDRPRSRLIEVPQQPLVDLRAALEARGGPE